MGIISATVSRAMSAAHSGKVNHGAWTAPVGSDRKPEMCVMDHGEKSQPAARYGYPIFFPSGELSSGGVSAALGRARMHDMAIVPTLERIDNAIKGEKEPANMSRDDIELSRASVVRCPHCQSFDVKRGNMTGAHAGPMDRCTKCGNAWPSKPGTLTMEQHMATGDEGHYVEANGLADQQAAADAKSASVGAGPPGMPGGPTLLNRYG